MQNAMLIAIPFFLLTMLVEWLYGKYKKQELYKFSDFVTNILLGVGNQASNLFVKLLIIVVYDYVYTNFAFWDLGNSVWLIIGFSIAFDFVFYWAHRWSHSGTGYGVPMWCIIKAKSITSRWHCASLGFTPF